MKTEKLLTTPYKGTNDTYPQDMFVRNYIFNTWRNVAKRFGYEEYDTPLLEDANLYRVKSGEELANTQLYNFVDKGGREIALRPELTPSVARMIAAKVNELTLPLRWFNIGRFYRYEKPQRGRRREFFQLNIDLFGVPTVEAELEIIQYVMTVMDEFKAPKDTYELRINNRYLLEYLFEDILDLDEEKRPQVGRAIDNYTKMEAEEFEAYLKELDLSEKQTSLVLDFLTWDLDTLKQFKDLSKGAAQLLELFSRSQEIGIENIRFEPSVMRGLQYYTGTVIEMFDIGSKDNPRALFGGGRYDDLLSIFEKDKLPAFGLGWGDVTMSDYLKTYNLIPETKTETEVFVTLMDPSLFTQTNKVVQTLREEGIKTEMQLTNTKLGNQLKYANKKNIPWVIVLGEDELKKGILKLKDMNNREELALTVEEAISKIKE